MPRSVYRRKFEKGLSRISELLAAGKTSVITFFNAFGITVADGTTHDFLTADMPKSLQQIPLSIAIHAQDIELQACLKRLVSEIKIIPSLDPHCELVSSVLDEVDAVLSITNSAPNEQTISEFKSLCKTKGVPVAFYLIDLVLDSFVPINGKTLDSSIPIKIRPHLHNPMSNASVADGTILFCTSEDHSQLNRKLLYGLPAPITKSSTLEPSNARGFKQQVVVDSARTRSTAVLESIRKHIAMGVRLRVPYSDDVFNNYPGVDTYVNKVSQNNDTELSIKFAGYNCDHLVNQAYAHGTIYDSLAEMISSLLELQTELQVWKERILIICDDDQAAIRDFLANQTGVRASVLTTQDALLLGHKQIENEFDYITRISTDTVYPPDYLASKLNAFKYVSADFISEPDSNSMTEQRSTTEAVDPCLTVGIRIDQQQLDFFAQKSKLLTGSGYIQSRYGANMFTHLRGNLRLTSPKEFELSVVIPIFNNGNFLLAKALPSLLRNNSWHSMEIILIDDGSTDAHTLPICRFLQKVFPNLTLFEFPPGGSGSASRARNKGIQLATSSAISFLDPDNEISHHGYDYLLSRYKKANARSRNCDFVSGYQVKVSNAVSVNAKHSYSPWPTQIKNPQDEFFYSGRFPTVSTQAAVIRKEVLIQNSISFARGAVGQDTLFGWELLFSANNPVFTNEAFIVYYAKRENSVTNMVDPSYFEKSLRREEAQVDWLGRQGLLQTYIEQKYEYFFERWYKEKLNSVATEVKPDATQFLKAIAQLYGQTF